MKYYGKEKCRILKEIRAEIARQNDIEWVVSECKHQGNCKGTCPKCEQEVRQLEKALARREALGKRVAVVGVSASIALSVTGCVNPFSQTTAGAPMPDPDTSESHSESTCETSVQGEEVVTDMGDVTIPGDSFMGEIVDGEFLEETTEPETEEPLMGDPVPEEGQYPEETTGVEIDVILPGVPLLDETEIEEPLEGEPAPDWEE